MQPSHPLDRQKALVKRLMTPQEGPLGVGDMLGQAAVATSPLPGVGDIVGAAADAHMYATEPESRTLSNALMSGVGLLPWLPAVASIKAFHGSPHKFDKFSMDHIGKGEGAQAYGHGLYFTDTEDVAEGYRKRLADPDATAVKFRRMDGAEVNPLDVPNGVYNLRRNSADVSYDELMQRAQADLDRAKGLRNKTLRETQEKNAQRVVDWLSENKGVEFKANPDAGALYTVNLDVEPDDLLDWDKPLSQQPKKVRDALESAGVRAADWSNSEFNKAIKRLDKFQDSAEYASKWRNDLVYREDWSKFIDVWDQGGDEAAKTWLRNHPTSAPMLDSGLPSLRVPDMLDSMAKSNKGHDKAAEALRKAGIKGIRYFDGNSRRAGEGTYNYVMFDDDLIEVVDKK